MIKLISSKNQVILKRKKKNDLCIILATYFNFIISFHFYKARPFCLFSRQTVLFSLFASLLFFWHCLLLCCPSILSDLMPPTVSSLETEQNQTDRMLVAMICVLKTSNRENCKCHLISVLYIGIRKCQRSYGSFLNF